jgi:hypothetical protein
VPVFYSEACVVHQIRQFLRRCSSVKKIIFPTTGAGSFLLASGIARKCQLRFILVLFEVEKTSTAGSKACTLMLKDVNLLKPGSTKVLYSEVRFIGTSRF